MKEFLYVYRAEYSAIPMGTPEERAAMTKRWMDWMAGINAMDRMVARGNRLTGDGQVVRSNNVVTNGPYAEIKESIGGYSVVRAENYAEAVDMAKSCPIFMIGGNVEVREISPL